MTIPSIPCRLPVSFAGIQTTILRLSYCLAGAVSAIILLTLTSTAALAEDTFIFSHPDAEGDRRGAYAVQLLQEILHRTEPEFGPFQLKFADVGMERGRKFVELKTGKLINVAAMPTDAQWEQGLIPVMVPIDMGLQSWRISLIDKKNRDRMRAVRTLAELQRLKVGVGTTWVTYSALQEDGFNVVPGTNYDGLFKMLMAGRFDYYPRGLKDVFVEFDARKEANPSLEVEDSLILFQPVPSLYFTSPNQPRLAKRISAGLEAMLKDGSLQRFAIDFYKDLLQRAHICSRRIFRIPNSNVDPALLKRKELWLDPLDPKYGVCPGTAAVNR